MALNVKMYKVKVIEVRWERLGGMICCSVGGYDEKERSQKKEQRWGMALALAWRALKKMEYQVTSLPNGGLSMLIVFDNMFPTYPYYSWLQS